MRTRKEKKFMETCKECIHYTPCWKATSVSVRQHTEKKEIGHYCTDFLDRKRVIVMPEKRKRDAKHDRDYPS